MVSGRCGLIDDPNAFLGTRMGRSRATHEGDDTRLTRCGFCPPALRGATMCFHFVIYGDRPGGVPAGFEVLEQASRIAKTCSIPIWFIDGLRSDPRLQPNR